MSILYYQSQFLQLIELTERLQVVKKDVHRAFKYKSGDEVLKLLHVHAWLSMFFEAVYLHKRLFNCKAESFDF